MYDIMILSEITVIVTKAQNKLMKNDKERYR